jgi:aldehyde dehydrogenase (NAD+)
MNWSVGRLNLEGTPVFSRFLHQGQICMSSNRIIVDAKGYDDFVERFVAHVQKLKWGDPRDPETVIGPITNSSQLRNMLDLMKQRRQAALDSC